MYIVVEVIMNMAEYTSSWQSAAGAAEERQYLNQGHQLSPNNDENNLI